MNHRAEVLTSLVAEGIVSFMNKKNGQWAIKYRDRYYPFEPGKCIGWKSAFDLLQEGDCVYFPLVPGYTGHQILLTHISPIRAEVSAIKSLEIGKHAKDITFWLLIPGLV